MLDVVKFVFNNCTGLVVFMIIWCVLTFKKRAPC